MSASLVGSEMCIRDSVLIFQGGTVRGRRFSLSLGRDGFLVVSARCAFCVCLLYTSDAADDM
eukprot:14046359-Alexandrium_andersonii.AAC.1